MTDDDEPTVRHVPFMSLIVLQVAARIRETVMRSIWTKGEPTDDR